MDTERRDGSHEEETHSDLHVLLEKAGRELLDGNEVKIVPTAPDDSLAGVLIRKHKARYHQDHRRRGWFSLFPPEVVDVNVVIIPCRNEMVGIHRHLKQTDYWFVAKGSLWVGTAGDEGFAVPWHYEVALTEHDSLVLEIPPRVWHGYRALEDDTILVYGLTERYDGTDEERRDYMDKDIDWDPEVR